MNNEELKQLLEKNKDKIRKAFQEDRATYDKWDKQSPIYVVDYIKMTIIEVSDVIKIKWMLDNRNPFLCNYFLSEESANTYKWLMTTMEEQITNAILNYDFSDWVSYKDLHLGDEDAFYIDDNKEIFEQYHIGGKLNKWEDYAKLNLSLKKSEIRVNI